MSDQMLAAPENASVLTPELVQKVADKVLALLREDLKFRRERQHPHTHTLSRRKGMR